MSYLKSMHIKGLKKFKDIEVNFNKHVNILVGENEAKLWADGRYFIQAAEQLKGSGIDLMKIATPGYDTINEIDRT